MIPGLPGEWVDQAACKGMDGSIFFASRGDNLRKTHGDERARYHEAREVCGRCPVNAECLDHALTYRISFGVWGGMTSHERAKLLRAPHRKVLQQWIRDQKTVGES